MRLEVADKYTIEFGTIAESHFEWLRAKDYAGWVVITDDNTRNLCLPLLEEYLDHPNVVYITCSPGEINKHLDTCRKLWVELFAGGVGRRWCAICLGGGVLEDMGGFVASTYKRGIDFLQIPTTLLSQVDSSVGGKLGVDFNGLKNSIGLFADPIGVWIDPRFLKTLPDREIRSGYAEIIKHALIADEKQWSFIQGIDKLTEVEWQDLISLSVDIKRKVVLEDPFEKGIRKSLNFGHTIGHAIESYWLESDLRLFHGEAIAAGMIMESWLSTQLAGLSWKEYQEIESYFIAMYGQQQIPEEAFPALLAIMQQDKKNDDSRINFTLLQKPGEAVINVTVDSGMIIDAMRFYNALSVAA